MKWTITNNNGVLYPTTVLIEGQGIDDLERKLAWKLAEKGWKRENVIVKNSPLVYNCKVKDGFLELEFLIEGQDNQELQRKLTNILNKMSIKTKNVYVEKVA